MGELLYEAVVVYPGGCEEFMVYGAEVSGVFRLGEHFRVARVDPGSSMCMISTRPGEWHSGQ